MAASDARSRKASKRSTGSSSATSGRSSASSSAAISASSRCSGASSAAGAISIASRLAEAALGEGREEADRLDLDVEEVDADRAVLGGRVEVEDAAADGELPAVVDLVDALVAGGHELLADLVEVEQVADADGEGVRAQRRVGHLLAQRDRADHDDRRLLAVGALREQRVERGDAQADEVRRRREVRLVGHAAAGVEAHRARVEPRAQVGGEVARLAVVARDHERRAVGGRALGQRGHEIGPHRLRHERAAAIGDERGAVGVLGEA